MASDGVWEFVSSQEAIDIVQNYDTAEEACRKVQTSPDRRAFDRSPSQLIDEAYHRWLQEENGVVDDITAVVVKFQHYAQTAEADV